MKYFLLTTSLTLLSCGTFDGNSEKDSAAPFVEEKDQEENEEEEELAEEKSYDIEAMMDERIEWQRAEIEKIKNEANWLNSLTIGEIYSNLPAKTKEIFEKKAEYIGNGPGVPVYKQWTIFSWVGSDNDTICPYFYYYQVNIFLDGEIKSIYDGCSGKTIVFDLNANILKNNTRWRSECSGKKPEKNRTCQPPNHLSF